MRRTITTPNRFIISTTSWLAKRAGLFLVILLLLSCEDEVGKIGFKNPNRDFEVFSKEFTIPSTVYLMDSVSTSNGQGSTAQETKRIMCGYMDNARFGKTTAIGYTQYFVKSTPPSYSSLAVYQGLTLTLIFDHYWQGSAAVSQQNFQIYELTDSILTYLPHFSKEATPYGPLVGRQSFMVNPTTFDEIIKDNADDDPDNDVTDSLKVTLNDDLGRRLFAAALDTVGSNELEFLIFNRFRRAFKGLAIVPQNNDKIIGFDPWHTKSRMTLKYKVDTTDYEIAFTFVPPGTTGASEYMSYTGLTTDRSGTPLAGLQQFYTDYEPTDGLRYSQGGTGVGIRLDFAEVRDHFKNIPVKAFSVAELSIETTQQESPTSQFILRALKPNGRTLFATKGDVDDAGDPISILDNELVAKHAIASNSLSRLEPVGDDGDGKPFALKQSSNTGGTALYSGHLTTFLQQETSLSESDFLRYFALIPLVPENAKSVSGFYFPPDKIKLKVYYTTPGIKE